MLSQDTAVGKSEAKSYELFGSEHRAQYKSSQGVLTTDPVFFQGYRHNEELLKGIEKAHQSGYRYCVLISSVEQKRSFIGYLVRLAASLVGVDDFQLLRYRISRRLFPSHRQLSMRAAGAKLRGRLLKQVDGVLKRRADWKDVLEQTEERLREPFPSFEYDTLRQRGVDRSDSKASGFCNDSTDCDVEGLLGKEGEAALNELVRFSIDMVEGEGAEEKNTDGDTASDGGSSADNSSGSMDDDYIPSRSFSLRFVTVTGDGIQSLMATPDKVSQSIIVADVNDILPSPFDLEPGLIDEKDPRNDDKAWIQKDTILRYLRSLMARNASSSVQNHLVLLAPVLPLSGLGHTPSRYVWEPFDRLARVHTQMKEKLQPFLSLIKTQWPRPGSSVTRAIDTHTNVALAFSIPKPPEPHNTIVIKEVILEDALSATHCIENSLRLRRTLEENLSSFSRNPTSLQEADRLYFRLEGALSALNCSSDKIREVTLQLMNTSVIGNENTLVVFNNELTTTHPLSGRSWVRGYLKCLTDSVSTVVSLERIVWVDSQQALDTALRKLDGARDAGYDYGGIVLFIDAALLNPRGRFMQRASKELGIDFSWVHHLHLMSPPRSLVGHIQLMRLLPSLRSPPIYHISKIERDIFLRAQQRLIEKRRATGYPIKQGVLDRKDEESAGEDGGKDVNDDTRDILETSIPNFLTELLVTTSSLAKYSIFQNVTANNKEVGLFDVDPTLGTTIDTVYVSRVIYEAWVIKEFLKKNFPRSNRSY